jgi:hypothetical protein
MTVNALAKKWRAEQGFTGRGGVIVIFDGIVNSWVNELRDPDHWVPGCIAVDESGNRWMSVGGNERTGAERWRPL